MLLGHLAEVAGVVAEQWFDARLEVLELERLPHLAGQHQREAGLAGDRDGSVGPLVGRHPAEEQGEAAVAGAEGEVGGVDAVMDHARDRHLWRRLPLRVRHRDHGHPRRDPAVEIGQLVDERPVDRRDDRQLSGQQPVDGS